MFLTRWLCVAEQQVHIWTQEAAGSGCRARRRRALSHCQSLPVQSQEVHFVGQLFSQNANMSKNGRGKHGDMSRQRFSSITMTHKLFNFIPLGHITQRFRTAVDQ